MMRSIKSGFNPGAPERAKAEREARNPMRRSLPEEVARPALFLASDESGYCTGGVYMIDDGSTTWRGVRWVPTRRHQDGGRRAAPGPGA